jgi:hypothetical protein
MVEDRSAALKCWVDEAHSCVAITRLRERKARPRLACAAARRTTPITTTLHPHSPFIMASGMARREVPDSEDEPMTSSPVDTSDGAADKLFATARVPLQDAQDALQEATGTHQATAESIANMPGKGCEGLDADENDASTDVDASKHVSNGVQSEPVTSSQRQSTEAGSSTADPPLPSIASLPEVRVDHMDAQHAAANISLDGQHEAERDLTDETNATTALETDITPSVTDVDLAYEQMSERTPSEIAFREVAPKQVNQESSSEATNDARHITGPRDDQPNATKIVTDTTGDQRDVSLAHAESSGGDSDVKHSVCLRSLYITVRVLTCYLDGTAGCSWLYRSYQLWLK